MTDSSEDSNDGEAFIGFKCEPEVKRRVEREAEKRGTTISEVVREGLPQGDGDA
jgi:hypothetical protein